MGMPWTNGISKASNSCNYEFVWWHINTNLFRIAYIWQYKNYSTLWHGWSFLPTWFNIYVDDLIMGREVRNRMELPLMQALYWARCCILMIKWLLRRARTTCKESWGITTWSCLLVRRKNDLQGKMASMV